LNDEPLYDEKQTPKLKDKEDIDKETNFHLAFAYTQFILENRLPFSLIKPLINLISFLVEQYPPNFLEDFSISRQTITKNAHSLAVHLKENLYGLLRTSPFSLSIDCSSDVYGISYLVICAKFQDQTNPEHLATKLITTIPITTSSTGEVL